MLKMSIQYLYGAGIWTHDLLDMSLLPKPIDQGSNIEAFLKHFELCKAAVTLVRFIL